MVNIITCSHKAICFLEKHIEAIRTQKGEFIHWIGVDGDRETLEEVIRHRHDRMRIFYSRGNVGKALLQNSLAAYVGQRQKILFFDADDYMAQGTIASLPDDLGDQIFSLPMINSNDLGRVVDATAIMVMMSDTYFAVGGFRTEIRVGHDNCFRWRWEKVTGKKVKMLPRCPPFARNKHSNSLTGAMETGLNSPYRAEVRKYIREEIHKGHCIIDYRSLPSLIEIT